MKLCVSISTCVYWDVINKSSEHTDKPGYLNQHVNTSYHDVDSEQGKKKKSKAKRVCIYGARIHTYVKIEDKIQMEKNGMWVCALDSHESKSA